MTSQLRPPPVNRTIHLLLSLRCSTWVQTLSRLQLRVGAAHQTLRAHNFTRLFSALDLSLILNFAFPFVHSPFLLLHHCNVKSLPAAWELQPLAHRKSRAFFFSSSAPRRKWLTNDGLIIHMELTLTLSRTPLFCFCCLSVKTSKSPFLSQRKTSTSFLPSLAFLCTVSVQFEVLRFCF